MPTMRWAAGMIDVRVGILSARQRELKIQGSKNMCRNIRTLFNFEPPATRQEIEAAALQYVRKVGGYSKPSQVNTVAHETAVAEIIEATAKLLENLSTNTAPKNRDIELAKARARSAKRFSNNG